MQPPMQTPAARAILAANPLLCHCTLFMIAPNPALDSSLSNRFDQALASEKFALRRSQTEILQVNVGKLCNLTCKHCHVNAGPARKEIMTRETVDKILDWVEPTSIRTVDLTGGAPEMIPDFKYFVERLRNMSPARKVIDRCNLTILLEPGFEGMAKFLAEQKVDIVASMPCYSPDNVNAQRGDGVFDASIEALQLLNKLGYGTDPELPLDLVYNPLGASLPPEQQELEDDYKVELQKHFGITFNRLYTITNMPIARFASYLKNNGEYESYLQLLIDSFNPGSLQGLMCRNTLSIGWEGEVYDCDFNQQLGLTMTDDASLKVWNLEASSLEGRRIITGDHCFGCTAGSGSSCGGALV